MEVDQSLPIITVVIPRRQTDTINTTVDSLKNSTFTSYKTVEVPDDGKGANWARNQGFKQVDTEFVVFSDNDIKWKSHALGTMVNSLKMFPNVSYAYGRYKLGNDTWSHQAWDPILLKQKNYISTMSLIRTKDLPNPPFDESIKRLQDWSLWLTMLEQGKRGIYVEDLIFETELKPGISHEGLNYVDAVLIVKKKHGL